MRPDFITIGLVEDDVIMGESLVQRLELEGHKVDWWTTGSDALNAQAFFDKDIIICDIRLPDLTGEAVHRFADQKGIASPFIFITGYGDIDQAVRLMRRGACDYVTKPFDPDDFLSRIERNAVRQKRHRDRLPKLGVSAAMTGLEKTLLKFSEKELPILISGEVGVGKETAARFVHWRTRSAAAPFVHFHCKLNPGDLHEKEVFGSDGSEMTGGALDRTGDGTLYLDDVDLLSPGAQHRLLALLNTGTFQRVGGQESLIFEGRIIASTRNLRNLLEQARGFSEALFYRLSVLQVEIAPLRERLEDIVWLMSNMLTQLREAGEPAPCSLSATTEEAAIAHDWPGNALEMRNRLQRALVLRQGVELQPADLFPDQVHDNTDASVFPSLVQVRADAERRQIKRALHQTGGQIIEAAKLLGVSRTTLWEKMNRLEIAGN